MKRHIVCFVFMLVAVNVCHGQCFDRIIHLKDAPFSAEVDGSGKICDPSPSWTLEIARASDGSVYQAKLDPVGEFKGSISNIKIEDATNNCNIDIHPYRANLRRDDRGRLIRSSDGLSIILEAAKTPDSTPSTVADIRNRNLQEQERIGTSPPIIKPYTKIRETSLGQRTVDGMTIFGFQVEHLIDSKTDWVEQRWKSELGFTYSAIHSNSGDGYDFARSLAGLKLVESPAALFTVQDKYFPPTRALPNARTIFISGLLGDEELTKRIESILTGSGRFTIAPDSKTAGLVVTSKFVPNIAVDQAPPRQILLEFNRPNGASVFWVSLRFPNRGSDQWEQSSVVNSCFADLWKRVEGVQPSSTSTDDELF